MSSPLDLCQLSDVYDWVSFQPSPVKQTQVVASGSGYTHITISAVSADGNGSGATFTGTLVAGALLAINIVTAGIGFTEAPVLNISGDGTGAEGLAYINSDVFINGYQPTLLLPSPRPSLITRASQMFLSLVNRPGGILPQTVSEQRNGNGAQSISVYNWPIITGNSVTINGNATPQSPDGVRAGWTNDTNRFYLVSGGGFPTGITGGYAPFSFCEGFQNVALGYTFGWATIPADITQAVVELVGQKYRRRQHIDQDSQNNNGQIVSFSKKDIPPEVQTVINQYKIKAIIQ